MGLDDGDLLDDGDGGGKASAVSCSICLEVVTDNGTRSRAKLHCGHEFHLDCIGSAFNIKGAMQCPNCRKIEKGQWLYANGNRPFPELNMEDWVPDDDLYDLSYSEMSFGVHWCPFSGLTRLPSSFDEGEYSSTAYHDFLGQHTIFAEHTAVSSATHPCPYIAYLGPIHPSSSSNSSASVSDVSSFNNHWNTSQTSPSDNMPTSYAFPTIDVHYRNWEHPSSSSRIGGADQPPIPSTAQRGVRSNADIPRSGSYGHPFLVGRSAARGAGSSAASSMIPPPPNSVARTRDRVQALQAYFQPSNSPAMRAPVMSGPRRSTSHRGGGSLPQVGPVGPPSDQTRGGFYYFTSGQSSSSSTAENSVGPNRVPSFPLGHVERDSIPGWGLGPGPFHHPAGGVSDTRPTNGFRQRYGSERMPSQNRS